MDLKELFLKLMLPSWQKKKGFLEGYALLMPMPMDMPFLLRAALEAVSSLSREHCGQIIVIPDGQTDDNGALLKAVIAEFPKLSIEYCQLSRREHWLMRHQVSPHWVTVVAGTNKSRMRYSFLHDADAFFRMPDSVERMYHECTNHQLAVLGIEARIDPFFVNHGFTISGTWEMFYSNQWLGTFPSVYVKGRRKMTDLGEHEFDTLLYPQFLSIPDGNIRIMANPPDFIHFHGTITTYRVYKELVNKNYKIFDEMFRLLLLAILERTLSPENTTSYLLPAPDQLSGNLGKNNSIIRYDNAECAGNFPVFKEKYQKLCESFVFDEKAKTNMVEYLRPFEEFYHDRGMFPSIEQPAKIRKHCLGIA